MAKIITKLHKAKIEQPNLEKLINLLDTGVEESSEPYDGKLETPQDYLDAANKLAEENRKAIKIKKYTKKLGEEFEIRLKYLV